MRMFLIFILLLRPSRTKKLVSTNVWSTVLNRLAPSDDKKFEFLHKKLPKIISYQNIKTKVIPKNTGPWGFFKQVETGQLFVENSFGIIPKCSVKLIEAKDPSQFNVQEVQNISQKVAEVIPYMKCLSSCFDLRPLLAQKFRQREFDEAEFLLKIGVESDENVHRIINAKEHGLTMPFLKSAVVLMETKIVKILIDAGADLNVKDSSGDTPLTYALWKDNVEIVKLLINAGADLEVTDNDGWTVVMQMALRGNVKMAKLLIDAGADLNVKNDDGNTAFDVANNSDMKKLTFSKQIKVKFLYKFFTKFLALSVAYLGYCALVKKNIHIDSMGFGHLIFFGSTWSFFLDLLCFCPSKFRSFFMSKHVSAFVAIGFVSAFAFFNL